MSLPFSAATDLSKLMQGMNDATNETFLFRVRRVPSSTVAPADMETAGLNRFTNPLVYFLVRADAWEEPGPSLAGPLTLDGALAVARSFTETFNRRTNYGAF